MASSPHPSGLPGACSALAGFSGGGARSPLSIAPGGGRGEEASTSARAWQPGPGRPGRAFTLIELLIVIAIIAILAALVVPITGAVNRNKIRSKARAEMAVVRMAIENYKSKLGHYPPDNPGQPSRNQLYFELLGTTNFPGGYATLDGSARILDNQFPIAFGNAGGGRSRINGFVNCSGQSGGDEGRIAQRFLPDLKPGHAGSIPGQPQEIKYLVSSIPWPEGRQPYPIPAAPGLNPFCYNSSNPTNNPNSYDLWVDVVIGGKVFRISNWSTEPSVVTTP